MLATSMEETPGNWQVGVWQKTPLNAAMLARMMVFLGTDVDRAQQLVTKPTKPANT